MPTDDLAAVSLESLRSLLALCHEPALETPHATSFRSAAERSSGFFVSTIGKPQAEPGHVIDQACELSASAQQPQNVWAPEGSPLHCECWQRRLHPRYALTVMSLEPGRERAPAPATATKTVLTTVRDHSTADMFRAVHLAQFASAPDPSALVAHFASDQVLLDPAIHAVVAVDQGAPVAAGYLHTTPAASGVYWVATRPSHRNLGIGRAVTAALLDAAPRQRPVVLQATPLGRPVYQGLGFRDHGLVWCWSTDT